MDTILIEIKNKVGIIRLNRPDKYNAFNREMALHLQRSLNDFASDSAIRSIYITGNGKAFSAGQDLGEVTGNDPIPFEKILSEHYNPIITRIRNIQKPVIAAVNGIAAGAGANIALCCDIVVANKSASFIQAFSKIGLIPDSGGTYFLPRLIGFQQASAVMMLGDKINSERAEQIGMIYKLFEDDVFEDESLKIAEQLSDMPTRGLWLTKQALNKSMSNDMANQLILEDQLQLQAAATNDYNEGVAAFIEKRKPNFTGE